MFPLEAGGKATQSVAEWERRSMPTPEEIAARLMAPGTTSALWTYDQVRRLIIEAAESAPMSAAERRLAWAALHMVRDAMGELFGPLAASGDPDHVPSYEREAEAIIAGLQRIADRMALNEAVALVGGSIEIEGENWTGEAHELAAEIKRRVKAIAPSSDAPKGSAGQ
jgi:hypothetical protein